MKSSNCSSIFSWIFLFFIAFSVYGQETRPFQIRNFTKQEYGAESQNWSVTQDQRGFIYAANNGGLLEYDGVEWRFYPSPRGAIIRSVAVDANNRVYTSGYREIGFWERDMNGKLEYHSLNTKAEPLFSQNEEFWNTLILGDKIYFHSFSSLFVYENDSFQVIRTNALFHSISNLNGRLCVHVSGQGLFFLEGNELIPFLDAPPINSDVVYFCKQLEDSTLLIGTASSGLFLYRENRLIPYLDSWRTYFSENKINRGILKENGNIVIGTLLDGVLVFDETGRLLHHFNGNGGLQNNTILGLYSDEDNNLWISMDKGLDYVSFLVDPSYTVFEFEEIGAVYSAIQFQGDLYLCTNQGVFYRTWENESEPFRMIPGTQGQAWNSHVYNDQLLISHNVGTFRIENRQAEQISNISGGFSVIRNPLNQDQLVQSTYSNIVFYEETTGAWNYAYQLPGFNDLIRYVELDHYNNLWASHMHRGVYRLKLNDSQDSILESNYLGNEVFGKDFDIQTFNIENRIVFTTGELIYTYDNLVDSIIPYSHLNQGLGTYAGSHRIVAGPDHHYWLVGQTGIALFQIFDSEIKLIKEYPRGLFQDHLISGYENILPLTATEGLLCMDNGLALLRADQPDLSDRIEGKRLMLKNFEITGRTENVEQLPVTENQFRIPFHKNSLTLEYAFPLFSNGPLAFQSFVEGLDNNWSEALYTPVFHFTRIPSGEYTIHIRAFNEWNKYSMEEQLTIMIKRPWYLSRLSMVFYTIVFLALLILGRNLLLRRIRIREQKIEEQQEKELIRLRNENLDAELSFKSQELANSTMAIIKKNEFLLELKETIKDQKEELGTRYPEKYFSRLVKKIDNNISSMDDWKVFEFHFEKAHEKFLQTLINKYPHLSHSDLRLCAYLRMNLSSKEIAPLLRISYRGVENHRYRLRKKLLLKKEVNLTDFILSI